jgi:hypothetical protein
MLTTILQSSLIQAARYEAVEQQMELTFCDGSVYRYFHVPAETFASLLEAESKGGYFHLQIRKRFQTVKLQAANATRDKS